MDPAAERNKYDAAAHILPTLTREELARLIAKRPHLWGQFSKWLDVLPTAR